MNTGILVIIAIAFVLIMRFVGAWMLRINEVIEILEDIRNQLKK